MHFFKHESAYVDDGAEIGEGCRIWHFCHVAAGARLGRGRLVRRWLVVAVEVIAEELTEVQLDALLGIQVRLAIEQAQDL